LISGPPARNQTTHNPERAKVATKERPKVADAPKLENKAQETHAPLGKMNYQAPGAAPAMAQPAATKLPKAKKY
jgi:hypothetical protein